MAKGKYPSPMDHSYLGYVRITSIITPKLLKVACGAKRTGSILPNSGAWKRKNAGSWEGGAFGKLTWQRKIHHEPSRCISGWWFFTNPFLKIWVKMGICLPQIGVEIKNIWKYPPRFPIQKKWGIFQFSQCKFQGCRPFGHLLGANHPAS